MTADNIRFLMLLVRDSFIFNITLVQSEVLGYSRLFNKIHRKSAPENVLTRFKRSKWGLFFLLSPVKIKAIIAHNGVSTFFCFVLCIVVARNMKERDVGSHRCR